MDLEFQVLTSFQERKILTREAINDDRLYEIYVSMMREKAIRDNNQEALQFINSYLNNTNYNLNININNINLIKNNIRVRNVARGVPYPSVNGYTNIPAWSRGAAPWNALSPFFIGPIVFEEYGVRKVCKNLENYYQSMKVYSKVEKQNKKEWKWPAEVHVDNNYNPNQAWFKWHDALLANDSAVRRPNGKNIPLYSYFHGRKLNLFEARKQIYIPLLQQLYRSNNAYKSLLKLVRDGINIIILEPDGPSYELYPDGMDVNLDLLYKLQDVSKMSEFPGGDKNDNRYVPYGHGYVIALTILEDLK